MNDNKDKVDIMTLTPQHLVMFNDKYGTRAWKRTGIPLHSNPYGDAPVDLNKKFTWLFKFL
jgi:hypothetical protein